MAAELLAQGDSLFVDEDYAAAVLVYTKVGIAEPTSIAPSTQPQHDHAVL